MQRRFLLLSGFLAVLVAAAPAAEGTTQAAPADFAIQLNEYVQVQEALAADDFETATAELEEFARITDEATRALAMHALEAGDIEEMRARFKPLSESLAEQALPQGFARAYCPMYDNGSAWVQRDGPVRNPYYGAFMLTCGVVDAAAGAHMDHSPQHGGTVFMAPDSFHHIEGTFPEPGLFRLYATDNYREPVDVSTWDRPRRHPRGVRRGDRRVRGGPGLRSLPGPERRVSRGPHPDLGPQLRGAGPSSPPRSSSRRTSRPSASTSSSAR